MASRSPIPALLGAGLSCLVALAATTPAAHAQSAAGGAWPPAYVTAAAPALAPQAPAAPEPATDQQPKGPQAPQAPPEQPPTPPSPEQNMAQEPFAGAEQAAATTATTVALADPGGYIDTAIPRTMFRLRFDAGFDMNNPFRAGFFFGEWRELSFHNHPLVRDGAFRGVFPVNSGAVGPVQFPGSLDYQEISPYFEFALSKRFSVFVDVPVRFVDFDNNLEDNPERPGSEGHFEPEPGMGAIDKNPHNNLGGLSDVQAGFKYALIADPDRYVTFQFRTYAPSGNPHRGLGTGHWTVEPGLLVYQQLSDRWVFQGQLSDWVSLDPSDFSGNVLIYGVGLGYEIYRRGNLRIVPITEFVGWTVLDGLKAFGAPVAIPAGIDLPNTHGAADAVGDTIVNAKVGVRTYFGQHSDIYAGFGQVLTGDRWYREIARVEYRLAF